MYYISKIGAPNKHVIENVFFDVFKHNTILKYWDSMCVY